MHEIKFRVWSFNEKIFHYFDVREGFSGYYGALSTPQQFTGLKDKNAHEIYEGDIVTTHHFDNWHDNEGFDVVQVVKWCNYHVGWRGFTPKMLNNPKIAGNGLPTPITVVGNIFENKDIIELK